MWFCGVARRRVCGQERDAVVVGVRHGRGWTLQELRTGAVREQVQTRSLGVRRQCRRCLGQRGEVWERGRLAPRDRASSGSANSRMSSSLGAATSEYLGVFDGSRQKERTILWCAWQVQKAGGGGGGRGERLPLSNPGVIRRVNQR